MPFKTFSYRIYPNEDQKVLLEKTFGCVRFVYNYYLTLRRNTYNQTKKGLTFCKCNLDLTKVKRQADKIWLKEVDKNALQYALMHLQRAYENFFGRIKEGKKGKKAGYPKYKRKKDNKFSYSTAFTNGKVIDGGIKLPKLGVIKAVIHRPLEGTIKSVTVKKMPSGKYFVKMLCKIDKPEDLPKNDKIVGIDLGLKTFAVLSNGTKIDSPHYYIKAEKQLARANKRMNKRILGSKNRNKARLNITKVYEKVSNRRSDFLHKASKRLIDENQIIVLEDLNVKGMSSKKRHCGKSFADAGLGKFRFMLGYKADWYGRNILYVDRFFPSSQLCSVCGFKNISVKDTKIRFWQCPKCKTEHDRDENAAQNLYKEGLKVMKSNDTNSKNRDGIAQINACGDETSTSKTLKQKSFRRVWGQVSSMKQEARDFNHG